MSSMKTNFSSTLNRWLGKKSKDKSTPNGKLSKSSTNLTNLSVSSTDINETSQLEYNRITPLPAATSNAPFEQTFRITVLLPKDQLYVTRLGARVPLSKLLELVCDHKLLEAEKYEFRNPVDPSQVYNNELTIGAVGLSEIRLCHKTDSYDTFNTDEVIKLHRTSAIRDSLSSSEFSSRNSKHTTKTTSPYSSSNSLNSMDSTGMNYTRTPVSPPPPLPHTAPPKMVQAPPRKKRAAPRPPSQMAIPEKSPLMLRNDTTAGAKSPETPPTRPTTLPVGKDYYVSTPNLSSSTTNGEARVNGNSSPIYDHGYSTIEEEHLYAQVEKKNARNLCGGSVQNLSSPGVEPNQKCPEPSPRRRLLHFKKKSAPAPPQRGSSIYSEDSISLASSTGTPGTPLSPEPTPISNGVLPMRQSSASSSITSEATLADATEVTPPVPPQAVAREADTSTASPLQASTPVLQTTTPIPSAPKPVPRQTTTTLLNASNETVSPPTTPALPTTPQANVSKVLLNRTPTPEPRSLSAEPPLELESTHISHHQHQLSELTNGTEVSEDDDNHSKQADSGIGEPVPSPVPDSLPSEGSTHDGKSAFESSSDDDDMVKVYNFKLGKTLIKPVSEHSTLEDLPIMQTTTTTTTTKTTTITPATTDSEASTPALPTSPVEERTPLATESTSWNFTAAPISPPPNFADGGKTAYELPPSGASKAAVKATTASEPQPDTPITPKIKQRPVLNFMTFTPPEGQRNTPSPVPPVTPASPITEIIDELSAIINEKRMDTLIKKSDTAESAQIEAAKPNTLTNFTISTITQQQQQQQRDAPTPTAEVKNAVQKFEDEETEQKINQGPTLIVQHERKTVARADSFNCTTVTQVQATATMQYNGSSSDNATNDVNGGGLNTRSASYLSLTKIEANGTNLNRRRSSSELSIGESPSLQSLEIIKTILNSRKNSAASGSGSDPESKVIITEIKPDTTEQTKPKKTETKTATTTTQSQSTTEEEKQKQQQQQESEPQLRGAVTKKETPSSDDEPPPRIYRYTGPPSINFSTWSERPKVQVSIKNEGDYIFGGKNASAVSTASVELSSASRNARASTPASPPTPTKPETTTLQRMGIPEQSSRMSVPITVRPLKDVTVESVELRSNAAGTQVSATKRNTTTLTFSVNAATPTTNNNINNNNNNKTQTNHITHTSTLPRAGNASNNRFSVPAPTNSTVVRANSITQLEGQRAKAHEESATTTTTTAAPFGQNTLRKTGLKEKILAQEQQQTNQQPTNNNNNNAKSTVTTTTAVVNAKPTSMTSSSNIVTTTAGPTINLKPVVHTKTLQSAKLELKLQKSTSVYVNQTSPTPPPPPPTAVKPQSKQRQQLSNTAITPPPPPPAPTVVVKSSIRTSAKSPSSADPRDALLEAIRNFKRAELKRA